ncbi:DUF7782 domain-containing protein [Corynebacterium sp. H113]|uniref:DUF7782 domain-containing protein n=1 Tax=Corynebacterium sp. H113 TaxID=3133419 RepID=UPI00309779FE
MTPPALTPTPARPPHVAPSDEQLHSFLDHAAALAEALRSHDYSVAGIEALLGTEGMAALDRGEPEAISLTLDVAANSTVAAPLISLVRALIIGDPADLTSALDAELLSACASCGVLRADDAYNYYATIDIRPVVINDIERIVFSDRDASMRDIVPGPNHVLGVGRASRSLLDITPSDPVGSVLDLGGGCGVQALGQPEASSITVTDIHPRANLFARATLAAANLKQADVIEGSWFEPVAGRTFDRVVANPPFVVGMPKVDLVYRDSGLNLDGATELVLSNVADHLTLGGTAHLLGAWAHVDGESWQQRIASWLPDHGVEAWIVQRDLVDPATYVGTWLRDESIDPRSHEGRAKTRDWLTHFATSGVAGIGFGYITLQRIDAPSSIVCEEMPQALAGPFAAEAREYLLRAEWLRDKTADDILATGFAVRPGVAIENVSVTDLEFGQGFTPAALRVTRTDGPRWSHDIDEAVHRVLSALMPEASLATTIDVMAMLGAIDESLADEVKEGMVPVIVDLMRHGIVLPADLLSDEGDD